MIVCQVNDDMPGRVLGLRQDLEQLIVREEEKPWEVETLLLQILVETLVVTQADTSYICQDDARKK